MNVLLINPIDIFTTIVENFKSLIPDVKVSGNFEDVYGMVKSGDVSRLCIIIGGYNYSGSEFNIISGQKASEEIHKIDPSIPILIWSGKDDGLTDSTNTKEVYLESHQFSSEDFFSITKDFYRN